MATSTKLTDQYNDKKSFVVRDLLWKDHISKIETAQKFYDERWGFLTDLELQNSLYDPKQISPSLFSSARSSLTSDCKNNEQKSKQDVTVNPSPRPVPATTNKLIGWRTGNKDYTLEKYGKYARGQESLHKKFNWPVEGFD